MTIKNLRAVIDNGPFVQDQALNAGLVDTLQYEDEFEETLKKDLSLEEIHKVRLIDYLHSTVNSDRLVDEKQIAIVYAVGSIMGGESVTDPIFGSSVLGSESFSNILREVKNDKNIEAVIVRIDSPGGDAFASDQMWYAMNQLREKKPVVISMADTAASGGYYIAMAKSPVLAYPGTTTGSIGVVFGKMNLRQLYDLSLIHI